MGRARELRSGEASLAGEPGPDFGGRGLLISSSSVLHQFVWVPNPAGWIFLHHFLGRILGKVREGTLLVKRGSKTISVKHNVHGEYTWEDFSWILRPG